MQLGVISWLLDDILSPLFYDRPYYGGRAVLKQIDPGSSRVIVSLLLLLSVLVHPF
jgi:hypothetical protein